MKVKLKEKKRTTGIHILLLVIIGLCFLLSSGKQKSLTKEKELEQKKADLQTKILKEEEKAEILSEEQAYRQTKQYLEKIAREKMGLVKPEDIIIREEEEN